MSTAPSILFAAAKERPEHVRFVVAGGDELTLDRLATEVASFASTLRARGIGRGDRVVIAGPNGIAWIVAALATQACGAAFVSIHAGSSREIASAIIRHSEPRLVLSSSPSNLGDAGDLGVPTLPLDDVRRAVDVHAPRHDASMLEHAACIIYTSGTTGRPKGVVLTHANLAANGNDWLEVCAPLLETRGETLREVLWLPLSHAFGWGDVVVGTRMGFTSFIAEPRGVPEALVAFRPHVLMTVPMLVEKLARSAETDAALRDAFGGELRLGLCGGAMLSPSIKRRLRRAGVCMLEGYGLTETSPTLTLERSGDDELDTVGRPYPSVRIKIGEDGEVLAQGPNVFGGYFRDEAATAEAFDDDGWFKTGDIGRLTPSGALQIVDRKKALIVLSTGKKVAPQPIEARAAEDPWIERLVLFGEGQPFLTGLVVPDVAEVSAALGVPVSYEVAAQHPLVRASIEMRIHALNASLSTFEAVRKVVISPRPLTVEGGELTPSLKVKRDVVSKLLSNEVSP